MSRLPTKSKGPIRVRSLRERGGADHRGAAFAEPPVAAHIEGRPAPASAPLLRLLRFPAVMERTGLSRSTIWRLEQRGDFPKHRRISANAVAWVEEEVLVWIHSKIDDVAF